METMSITIPVLLPLDHTADVFKLLFKLKPYSKHCAVVIYLIAIKTKLSKVFGLFLKHYCLQITLPIKTVKLSTLI